MNLLLLRNLVVVILTVLLLVPCPTAWGDESAKEKEKPKETVPPFTADRPGYSESSSVVGKDIFQIELGLQQELHQRYQHQNITYFDTLLRYGLSKKLELRVEGNTFQQTQTFSPNSTTWGLNETSIGFKYNFQDQPEGSGRPSLGILGQFSPATGSNGLKPVHSQEQLQLLMDWQFAPHWTLTSNVGAGIFEDSNNRLFGAGTFTCSLNRDLSDKAGVFLEVALQAPEQTFGKPFWALDYGVHYMIGPDTQLDASLGHGLGGFTSPDFFWAVGVTQRWR